jgi:hypothetical protein
MPTTSDLREAVDQLHALAANDLRDLWRQITNVDEARAALEDVLPLLVRSYGAAAATVAADWYDDLRDELNASRRFTAIAAEVAEDGAEELARWGIKPLFQAQPDWDSALTLVDGGLQRRIANGARETVRVSALADPGADGWQRVASAGCSFCQMLAGRGAVYSEARADFASHDHCRCHAVPAFSGRPRPVKPYTPSERVVTDADRERVRRYLATHDVG